MGSFVLGMSFLILGAICIFSAVVLINDKLPGNSALSTVILGLIGVVSVMGAFFFFCCGREIPSSSARLTSFESELLPVVTDPEPQENTGLEVCLVENDRGVRFEVIVASSLQVKKGDKVRVWNLEFPHVITIGTDSISYVFVASKE